MSRELQIEVIREDGDFKRRVWTFRVTDCLRPSAYAEQVRVTRRGAWRRSTSVAAPLLIDVPRDVLDEATDKAARAIGGTELTPEVLDLARHWASRTASGGPVELTDGERATLVGWVKRRMERAVADLRAAGHHVTEGSIALHVARDLRGPFVGRDGEPTLLAYDLCRTVRVQP